MVPIVIMGGVLYVHTMWQSSLFVISVPGAPTETSRFFKYLSPRRTPTTSTHVHRCTLVLR